MKTPTGEWSWRLPEEALEEAMSVAVTTSGEGITIKKTGEELGREELALLAKKRSGEPLAPGETGGLLVTITGRGGEAIITHEVAAGAKRRTIIIAEPGTKARITERFSGSGTPGHALELYLGERAELHYASIQQTRSFQAEKRALLAAGALLHWLELGAASTKNALAVELAGENAALTLATALLGTSNQHFHVVQRVRHAAPRTKSLLVTRGVLDGESKAAYEGVLRVTKLAEGSDARQEEECLLLSDGAAANAAPILFIEHDNVRCSHAATTSTIDEGKRFYLESRGLPPRLATSLLITSFLQPVLAAHGGHEECAAIITEYARRGGGEERA